MKHFIRDEDGATAIEYALICTLIVLASVAAISALGGGSNGMWSNVSEKASNAM